jgi:signal transduction histidine kinase
VEVLAVAPPMRWIGFDRDFSRTESLVTFYLLVVFLGAPLSSALAAITLHETLGLAKAAIAFSWYGADALGLSLLVPFLMCVKLSAVRDMFSGDQLSGSLGLLALVVGCVALNVVFSKFTPAFIFVPVLILLTFKRGFAGGAVGLGIAVVTSFSSVFLHHVSAYIAPHPLEVQIILVQLYYAVVGCTIIMAGAALDDRIKLERWLATVVKRAEASREEALLAKEVAERASTAKSTFLANMSHELRTPLNAVLGFSEMIRGEFFGPVGDTRYREYAGMIHGAGSHLLELITDVLDMSKIEAGKLELHRDCVGTGPVVRACTELLEERAASAGVALVIDLTSAPRSVDADKRALKQILLNLLSNAIKFTPSGGTITVSVRPEGEFAAFSVEDTGVGISASDLRRIGNPFVQLGNNDGSKPGTGLGLALVRALAEMHGGSLRIESVEGQGTKATATIPAMAAQAAAA